MKDTNQEISLKSEWSFKFAPIDHEQDCYEANLFLVKMNLTLNEIVCLTN
jgi:hypothetical protein